MSINRVVISGNLTRDAELRMLPSGSPVLSLGVAVNDRRKNSQSGEWEDYPNYIDCSMFGTRAERIAPYLTKGTKVAIEGKLRYSSWTTKDNQKRSKVEVIVDEIEFMSSRNQQGGYQQAQGGYQQAQGAQQYQQAPATPQYRSAPASPQAQYQPQAQPQPTQAQPAQAQAQPAQGGYQPTYAQPAQAQAQVTYPAPVQTPPPVEVYDEDIPF